MPGKKEYCNECNATVVTWYATIGFDPAISSCFYVFQVVEEDYMIRNYLKAVEIYSSETGTWDLTESESECIHFLGRITYFNGFLHLPMSSNAVASVGTKGQPWRVTQVQYEDRHKDQGRGYVGHSQGRLLYVSNVRKNDVMSIYVLEDKDSGEWTLKHKVSKPDLLFEPWKFLMGPTYYIAGFHPND
nr:unnamed protein product [Digitaria exilis]